MASSYFTESEAPRDFRVSSTESDGHYTKCLLCYTVKRNFYCTECIRTGNFIHSSMPYSDRYSEKQAKLLRLRANRKYILDRCEKLLLPKLKKDTLLTEAKQSRDRLDLLRLAIEQRKNNIEEKRKELQDLKTKNNELRLKLPRYQKRVSTLGKHAQQQNMELQNKASCYSEKAEDLAALRRSRIRQLTKYIFPVYITYDTSDSIEDMEFIGSDTEEELPKRPRLHIVAPWINTDGDLSHVQAWIKENKESISTCRPGSNPWQRSGAALSLAAQLLSLLAWTLDHRLPHTMALSEYSNWRACDSTLCARLARVAASAASLCAVQFPALHTVQFPPLHTVQFPPLNTAQFPALHTAQLPAQAGAAPHPLAALHALALAAATDHPALARVSPGLESEAVAWAAQWAAPDVVDDAEPEHLHWPENMEEDEIGTMVPGGGAGMAAPATSLVTSAAASIASMWRGWTK